MLTFLVAYVIANLVVALVVEWLQPTRPFGYDVSGRPMLFAELVLLILAASFLAIPVIVYGAFERGER